MDVIQSIGVLEAQKTGVQLDRVAIDQMIVTAIVDRSLEIYRLSTLHHVFHVINTQRNAPMVVDEVAQTVIGLGYGYGMEPKVNLRAKGSLAILGLNIQKREIVIFSCKVNVAVAVGCSVPTPASVKVRTARNFRKPTGLANQVNSNQQEDDMDEVGFQLGLG